MKNLINFILLLFSFAALSFVEYSHAYKASPTQPTLLDLSNNMPIPDYSNCSNQFSMCAIGSPTSFTDPIFLIDNCGDPTYYEKYSLTSGDPLDCASSEQLPIDCESCECPVGEYRTEGMCVPVAAQSCSDGIANYLTGECYPPECPYGDGSPEDCKQVEYCPTEEGTVLNDSSCICPIDSEWNPYEESCVEIIPNCDGENGSAIGSFFNFETESCDCPSSSIFDSETNVCERQHESICDFDEYLGVDMSCHKYPNRVDSQNLSCNYAYSGNPDPDINAGIKQGCSACVAAGGSPVLHPVSTFYDPGLTWSQRTISFCFMPENSEFVCESEDYFWDEENNLCRDVPASSSSSASSNSSSSSSSASSVSSASSFSGSASSASSSGNSGGGGGNNSSAGSSSGGSGGNGGNGGDGGSNSGGGDSSSGNSSSAGSGECDPESSDYLTCIGDDLSNLPSHTQTDSGFTSIDQVHQAFVDRVTDSPIISSFNTFKNIVTVEASECPEFSIDLTDTIIGVEISTDLHCQIMENIRPILTIVMLAVFAFLGFRIVASA